jgi:DNA repair protein RadC
VVVLTASHRVLRVHPLTTGTDNHCLLDDRDVLTAVLRHVGAAFALLHTHPSGDARPSSEDHAVTESLGRAAEAVGLAMIDHIVIAGTRWSSVTK